MKVIHVPFCFHPDPVGGTEIYVEALAHYLQEQGLEAIVAAPGETSQSYVHDGLRVRRFQVFPGDLRQLYGEGDPHAAAEFDRIVEDEKPDLVHVHAFTQGVSLRLVRAAKKRGLPVVFTYHTPTVSCQRGTLILWGTGFCDGKQHVHRCAGCTLHGLGLNRPTAHLVGALPPAVGRFFGDAGFRGRMWTALRMSELMDLRHAAFRGLMTDVDHVVAVCHWVREVLLLNDVPAEKITLCRHGIRLPPGVTTHPPPLPSGDSEGRLRIVFVGRYDPTKGIHVLVDALRMEPTLAVQLDIYGVVQSEANERYRRKILALAANDPRIRLAEPLPAHEVVPTLRGYDVLAVPSQWLETGPLVALEAFAAGIPVIGWNIGGVAEIVQHGVNGLLVEPDLVWAWVDAFHRLAGDPVLLAELKAGVRMPRSIEQVALETIDLYSTLLRPKSSASPPVSTAFAPL